MLYARTGAPVWTGLRMMVEDLAVDVDLASAALNVAGGGMSSAAALVQLSGTGPRPARDDVQVTQAMVLGTSAWIAFRYDRSEAARRAACGLGPVLAWDLLDTLMDLPAGLPVPAAALTRPARQAGLPGSGRGGAHAAAGR